MNLLTKICSLEKFPVTWIIAVSPYWDGSANIDGHTFKNNDFDVYHPFQRNSRLSTKKASNRLCFDGTVSYGNTMTTASSSRSLSLISERSWSENSPC